MPKPSTVRDWPVTERPRERLAKFGAEALSTQELLAVLLGRGTRGESIMVMVQRLLADFGGPKGLAQASFEELRARKGIGMAKAAQIKAAVEIGRRLQSYPDEEKKGPITNADDAVKVLQRELADKKKEHFCTIYLDARNRVIDTSRVSIGSLTSSVVHPREAFTEAIASKAASIIFVHNHPSGDVQPSDDDIEITRRLVKAGEVLGIEVLDHIIVGGKDSLSMKAKRII